MSTISVSLPADGSTADVADYNTPITTIVNAINGGLDSTNISSLSGTKITAGTIPGSALDSTAIGGYITGLAAPNTVTALGNRSYSMVFNSVNYSTSLSAGMRLRTTRTVAAPTQCTSLNGTTQYYSKTSPAGMTFTDDFTVSAWVKVSSYALGAIAGRYNGTSGWEFHMNADGTLALQGYNAGAANFSQVASYQSLPLNKWVHITAQLDMSTFTATTTTSYIMIDGVDVPVTVSRGGTNPTALIQAGDLNIGASNATRFFPGKIAQIAIYSAKVTQATILASIDRTLAGSETSLISAYSFNNTINDLSANANNLTANGSAVATNADSPFGGQADGTISSTLDYAIIQKVAFSTNTTVTVQVPEGCTIPTSGGVSAVVYAPSGTPYGFPKQKTKWQVQLIIGATISTIGTSTSTTYAFGATGQELNITAPLGEWFSTFNCQTQITPNAATIDFYTSLSTSTSAFLSETTALASRTLIAQASTSNPFLTTTTRSDSISVSAATKYYPLFRSGAAFTVGQIRGSISTTAPEQSSVYLENALL
jgi:hypothetical protein